MGGRVNLRLGELEEYVDQKVEEENMFENKPQFIRYCIREVRDRDDMYKPY